MPFLSVNLKAQKETKSRLSSIFRFSLSFQTPWGQSHCLFESCLTGRGTVLKNGKFILFFFVDFFLNFLISRENCTDSLQIIPACFYFLICRQLHLIWISHPVVDFSTVKQSFYSLQLLNELPVRVSASHFFRLPLEV